MKYEAEVDAYELTVTRNRQGGITEIATDGPIREYRGTYVYEYPVGRLNTMRLGEVLVVWRCGIHQCFRKSLFEEMFRPKAKSTRKPGRTPQTQVVLTEETAFNNEEL